MIREQKIRTGSTTHEKYGLLVIIDIKSISNPLFISLYLIIPDFIINQKIKVEFFCLHVFFSFGALVNPSGK